MSRSVKQDYDALRKPQHLYVQESGTVRYIGATVPLTDEQYFGSLGGEYERKTVEFNVSPTNEDWGRYHRAKAGLLALQNYAGTEWGGPDYGTEVHMPKPRTEYTYTETHDEWIERCRSLQAERKAA